MGETPVLWSQVTVTVNRRNQAVVTDILKIRRMEAVRKIVISEGVLLSEEGWMSVIAHKGLGELNVRGSDLKGLERELLGRVVSSIEEVTFSDTELTLEQCRAVFTDICEKHSIILKMLDISGNQMVGRMEPELLASAVTRLEEMFISDTGLTAAQVTAILMDICARSTLKLVGLDISDNQCVSEVEPGLLARTITRLEVVDISNTGLGEEQVQAILNEISNTSNLTLEVLDISRNQSVSRVEPELLARIVTNLVEVSLHGTKLTVEQLTEIFFDISHRSSYTLKVLDISAMLRVRCVEPGLLARAVISLEKVIISYTALSEEQVTAIFRHICDSTSMTLKWLDISNNNRCMKRVDPRLLVKVINKIEKINLGNTEMTKEQKDAIRETIGKSSCRVNGL